MLTILKLKDEEESIDIGLIRTVILQRPSNMIYCETNGKLTGVISMGDLLRACRKNQNQVIVNKQFTSIQYGKFIEAKNIFGSAKNINALPIITEKNTLVGDYTRWDDLLVLEYLIQADNGRCIEEWGEGREIVLVRPNKLFRMRQKIFEEFKKYLGKHQAKFQCIENTEVSAFLKKTELILFVDENEIRACKTALYLLHRENSAHYKMKTYRNILNDNLGFGDEECALYLKKLRNKGVRILGLRFEESAYSRQFLKEIELRYERERAALCATLPEVMHQEFFGELYNEEYASGILNRPLDYENNGGVYSLKDCRSQYYNIVNGERCTENQPEYYEKSIYFFGPCYIYGHYVEDKNTIESMLQKKICSHGRNVRVVNCGSMGTDIEYRYLPRLIATQLKKGDIVVLDQPPQYIQGVSYLDLNGVLEKNNAKAEWMADKIWHCNHKINRFFADAIYNVLAPILEERVEGQGELIDKDEDFVRYLYLDCYFHHFDYSKINKTGSVVMNCNPFTHGHRYLIEQALEIVDFLIVFVVEEDKSVFSFAERIAMVKKGVEDFENVMVVPSGPFISSQITIPEYFNNKQMTENAAEHDEQDATVFAEKIALPLGIRYRFFGEEPLDEVTNLYNDSMKKVLPQYGIEAVIIPRKICNGSVISASTVRKVLAVGNLSELNQLLPQTTMAVLGLELKPENES